MHASVYQNCVAVNAITTGCHGLQHAMCGAQHWADESGDKAGVLGKAGCLFLVWVLGAFGPRKVQGFECLNEYLNVVLK